MNLNHLYYFRALAKEEHYTRTADMLSITQPSLSHAISCLESELGVKLFEKQGRNAKLTKYGALFFYVMWSSRWICWMKEKKGGNRNIRNQRWIY